MCSTYMFVASLQLLSDTLAAVNRLSLAFQCTSVDLSIIRPLLNSTLTTLEKLKDEVQTAFFTAVRFLAKDALTGQDYPCFGTGDEESY